MSQFSGFDDGFDADKDDPNDQEQSTQAAVVRISSLELGAVNE